MMETFSYSIAQPPPPLTCTALTMKELRLCHVALRVLYPILLCRFHSWHVSIAAHVAPPTPTWNLTELQKISVCLYSVSNMHMSEFKPCPFPLGKRAEHVWPHHLPCHLLLLVRHNLSPLGQKREMVTT